MLGNSGVSRKCVRACVCVCGGGGVGVADRWSAKLETMCRQELKANIYRALICIGSSEFPAWVSGSTAELRNTEGAWVVIRQTVVD